MKFGKGIGVHDEDCDPGCAWLLKMPEMPETDQYRACAVAVEACKGEPPSRWTPVNHANGVKA